MIMWQPGVTLADMEKKIILKAFECFQGNKTKTASALGIAVRTLDNKLALYGVNANVVRNGGHIAEASVAAK